MSFSEIVPDVTVEDVAQLFVTLQVAAGHTVACCPFHEDAEPSMYFYPDDKGGHFHCFGCGAHGDPITFVRMQRPDLDFAAAVAYIQANVGTATPKEKAAHKRRKAAASAAQHWPTEAQTSTVHSMYLAVARSAIGLLAACKDNSSDEARAIRQRFGSRHVVDWGLGLMPRTAATTVIAALRKKFPPDLIQEAGFTASSPLLWGRLLFPLVTGDNKGKKIVGFASRRPISRLSEEGRRAGEHCRVGKAEPKYLNSRTSRLYRKSQFLYGLHREADFFKAGGPAIIVEGYGDVIALSGHFVPGVVASCGTALTGSHLHVLRTLGAGPIRLLYDGDKAGRKAAVRGMEVAEEAGVDSVTAFACPEGQDPETLVHQKGSDALRDIFSCPIDLRDEDFGCSPTRC